MKRGIPREGSELALDKRDSIDDAYWGGAIFMLLADVGIRRATGNKKSFDDVLRLIVSEGGDATAVWTLPEVVAAAKKATGTDVVADLVERLAVKGERVDLDALWRDLGVVRSPHPALDDTAKDAAIRRSIDGSAH
jgi:predicted metalloprotease with PDZ domain